MSGEEEKPRLVVSAAEQQGVSRLSAGQRYLYFLKKVADCQSAWGLWDDGWALYRVGAETTEALPLWPAIEYAENCACDSWSRYQPKEISVDDLLSDMIPALREMGRVIAAFPNSNCQGVVRELRAFDHDLAVELSRF